MWPPADRAFAALDERLYDLEDDDNREIVGVIHPREGDAKSRKLSIYKLSHGVVTLISQIDVTHPYPAYQILGIRRLRDRKQIVLGLAKGQKFGGEVFLPRGYRVPVGEDQTIDIADVDGDEQEAMRFVDKETGQSIILKGEKEFSPTEPVLR